MKTQAARAADFDARNKALLSKIARRGNRLLTADGYEGMVKILDARRVRLKMTMEELDARTGLGHGHSAKLFCGTRHFGNLSLRKVLLALGAKIAIVPSRVGSGKRLVSNNICGGELDKDRNRAAGKLGGLKSRGTRTPQEWREFCRVAGLASGKKRRQNVAAKMRALEARKALVKKLNGSRQQNPPDSSA